MESLNLTSSAPNHLAANAAQTLLAIDVAVADLTAARAAFSAERDTRAGIEAAVRRLSTLVEELTELDGRDMAAFSASLAFNQYKGRVIASYYAVNSFAHQVLPTEDETKAPLRQFRHAVSQVSANVMAFSEERDTRPAIIEHLGKLKAALADFLIVDKGADRWVVSQTCSRCDSAIAILRETIPTAIAVAPVTELRQVNGASRLFLDELDQLITCLSCFGNRSEGGIAEAGAIKANVYALRQRVAADPHGGLDEMSGIAEELNTIQRDVRKLASLRSSLTRSTFPAMQEAQAGTARQIQKLLAMVPSVAPISTPAKSLAGRLLDNIRGGFGWEDDEATA